MKHNNAQTTSEESVLLWAAVSTKIQDKYSVEDQLRLGREWVAKQRATVVEELVVRGFSRDYWTLADVVAAAAHDPDMEAFAKLQAHIRKKSFTVFLCFDADRFGRTASLVQEIIGRITRDCNARIYTLFDNVWMDAESGLMIGTMKGFKAQQDLSKLKDYRVTGMDNRARDGKSTAMIVPVFQKRIRNADGRETGVAINEDMRPLFTDIATVILRGTPWGSTEKILFEEFGHGRGSRPLGFDSVRRMVLSFAFWGHAAINYRKKGSKKIHANGPWLWDEHIPPPSPIIVYRNRFPAVYSGDWLEVGEQVKAELWRRYNLSGSGRPMNTFRFHGLIVCDECGYTMNKFTNRNDGRGQTYVRCESRFGSKHRNLPSVCSQSKHVRVEVIQAYFSEKIQERLDGLESDLFDDPNNADLLNRSIEDLDQKVTKLRKRNGVFADEIADAKDEEGRRTFRGKMSDNSAEIDRLLISLDELHRKLSVYQETHQAQDRFFEQVEKNGLPWLWDQSDTFIHQGLSAALGQKQLVVRDGIIIGDSPAVAPQIKIQRKNAQ